MSEADGLKKKIVSGGFWALSGRLATIVVGLLMSAVLARIVTPAEMGAYFLVVSLINVTFILSSVGMDKAVVRLIPYYRSRGNEDHVKTVVLKSLKTALVGSLIVGGLFATGLGSLVSRNIFKSTIMAQVTGIIAVLMVLRTVQWMAVENFRGFNDIRSAVLFRGLLTNAISVLFFAFFWLTKGSADFTDVMIMVLVASVISVSMALGMLRKKAGYGRKGQPVAYRRIFKISVPMWLSALLFFVITSADLWIVGGFLQEESIALYGAAQRIVHFLVIPLGIVKGFLPPIIAELHTRGQLGQLQSTLQAMASIAGIPCLLALGVLIVAGGWILEIVFGEFYRSAAPILMVLSIGQVFTVLAGSCGFALMMTGHQNLMLAITAFSAVCTIGASIMAVHLWGALGVAFVTSAGLLFQNILMIAALKIRVGVWSHAGFRLGEIKRIVSQALPAKRKAFETIPENRRG